MRNSEQQLQEVLSRAEKLRAGRTLRKKLCLSAGSFVLCLALLVLTAACLPKLSAGAEASVSGEFGSLILGTPALGYVLIGVLCFGLGAAAVLFALTLRRWKGREK